MATNQIVASETKKTKNNKGPYLHIRYVNGKGESKETALVDQTLQKQFEGPGEYDMTWEKKGEYFNLTAMKKIGELKKEEEQTPHPTTTTPRNGLTDKSISAQVCVKAAAEIASAIIHTGNVMAKSDGLVRFKDTSEAADFTAVLAKTLMDTIFGFVEPKTETPKTETPETK